MVGESALEFTITAVNPLDHETDIKQLFVTHERADFPSFFDRAYPAGVRAGGVSWIGRNRAGQVVMHVACFPQRFRFGEREVVGGLMINALVARPYRSFFPAHAMIRRAKRDTKARGDIDFIYTDPNEQAKAVMDMCGFARVGTLTRYVLPVSDRRRLVDGAIRLFHLGVRAVTGSPGGAPLVGHLAAEFAPAPLEAPSGDSPRLRPYHSSARYAMRMEGYPAASDWRLTLPRNGDASASAAGRTDSRSRRVATHQGVHPAPGVDGGGIAVRSRAPPRRLCSAGGCGVDRRDRPHGDRRGRAAVGAPVGDYQPGLRPLAARTASTSCLPLARSGSASRTSMRAGCK